MAAYARSVATESLADLVTDLSHQQAAGTFLGRAFSLPGIGGLFARLARTPTRTRWLTTRITRLHARILRLAGGRLRRSWLFAAGQPVAALTTTGRRSGLQRTTAVAVFCDTDLLALAGMNLGGERTPDWAYNLEANPNASITVGGRTIAVTARRTEGAERARLWDRWVQLQPSAETLANLAGRRIPIFVLDRREN